IASRLHCMSESNLERVCVAEGTRARFEHAPRSLQLATLDRVLAVGPQSVLSRAAGTDDGEGRQFGRDVVIRAVPVAVEPEADLAGRGHPDQFVQVAESVRSAFGLAALKTYRIVSHENTRPAGQASEQAGQPVELEGIDAPAGIPGPAVRRGRVDGNQPQ